MTLSTAAATKRGRGDAGHRKFAYLMATPAMILFILVIAYPLVQALAYGFTNASLLTESGEIIGLTGLTALLSDVAFWRVVGQTLIFVAGTTGGSFILALAMAMALNTRIRAVSAWRSALLIPWLLPGVVVSFLWAWIFNTNYGLLNGVIAWFGGAGDTNWLDSPTFAMIAVVIAKIWTTFPWMAVLLLAALQGVPEEVHDAAAVDGAKGWKKQWHVILPQIKPAIALTLLLEAIWGFQHFEIPYVMTGGGPVGSTTTLAVELYQAAFERFDLGEAGSIGIVWTALMSILVVVYLIYTSRQEQEAKR
ncbi:carbohydrate ABC transporter permease [Leucobacter tenebrionis]|uniref:carbohydrate ABC transporter permease n=1 Tax=Leucobacter tenebrionis TaxID=2873270 RepID=UPI001CA645ED|nr:sugar ABC transporter permease [Leucobacter tenebrionis]QZY53244.1 sugar ABC transporter permease [Leucobacter tenebrionis]